MLPMWLCGRVQIPGHWMGAGFSAWQECVSHSLSLPLKNAKMTGAWSVTHRDGGYFSRLLKCLASGTISAWMGGSGDTDADGLPCSWK